MRTKHAFVHKLNRYDNLLRTFFDHVDFFELDYITLQFVCALFILYFVGLRPGHREAPTDKKEKRTATYKGLLTLNLNNVQMDHDPKEPNSILFDFIEKNNQLFHHSFVFPSNLAKAFRELIITNRVKYGKDSYLLPQFVPVEKYL